MPKVRGRAVLAGKEPFTRSGGWGGLAAGCTPQHLRSQPPHLPPFVANLEKPFRQLGAEVGLGVQRELAQPPRDKLSQSFNGLRADRRENTRGTTASGPTFTPSNTWLACKHAICKRPIHKRPRLCSLKPQAIHPIAFRLDLAAVRTPMT